MMKWATFKKLLLSRFQHSQAGDAYEMLMALRQTEIVTEYRERFESLSTPLTKASDEMLMGAFGNGLKEEIRVELWVMRIGLLQDLMDSAHGLEERNAILDKAWEDFLSRHLKIAAVTKWTVTKPNAGWTRISGAPKSVRTTTLNPPNISETKSAPDKPHQATSTASNTSRAGSSVKRLTDAEIAKKRELGLCYRCDEKYSPSHRCKNR